MKKILVAAILSSASVGAFAYDAQVNFTGSITDQTCDINGQTAHPASINVPLSTVGVSSFAKAGDWSNNTLFQIKLTNCTAATTTVKWEPMANVDSSTGALINQTSGGSNVQIRVLKADAVTPVNMTNDTGVSITGASGTLNYYAQYYAKVYPVTTGDVSTYGYITLTY